MPKTVETRTKLRQLGSAGNDAKMADFSRKQRARLERLELPTRLDDPCAAMADLVDDLVLVGNDGHRLQDAEERFEGSWSEKALPGSLCGPPGTRP